MKTVCACIVLFLFPLLMKSQNCSLDTAFVESCVIKSRVIEPGMRIGFLNEYINESSPSPLLSYDSLPNEMTKKYIEDNGIPKNQLKDLVLTVTGIENIPYRKNKPLTFFTANGSDGKRYRYYISMATDTLKPAFSFLWGVYLVEEFDKFSKLTGQTLYGKDQIWSEFKNGQLQHLCGMKYYPIEITEIMPCRGVNVGSFYIRFKPEGMEQEYYRYCENSAHFYSVFTFCNPRDEYKSIKEKEWIAIQKGIPEPGMSKEIVELTLGKADAKSTQKSEKEELELWYYKNTNGKSYNVFFKKDKVKTISTNEYHR